MNTNTYITLRVHKKTHHQLRLIAAMTDESIIDTVARLAAQELERLEAERARQKQEEKQP
jgi:hypothetical protein